MVVVCVSAVTAHEVLRLADELAGPVVGCSALLCSHKPGDGCGPVCAVELFDMVCSALGVSLDVVLEVVVSSSGNAAVLLASDATAPVEWLSRVAAAALERDSWGDAVALALAQNAALPGDLLFELCHHVDPGVSELACVQMTGR